MTAETNTRILLKSRPVGAPTRDDFDLVEEPLPTPGDGEVLLRTRYLSLDPYMRGRMSDAPSYADPTPIGEVMPGATVGEVVASNSPERKAGDLVLAFGCWQSHAAVPAKQTRLLDADAAPVTAALGVLGMPGFTAWSGLTLLGQPKPGETVVVAAATGPVGATVGQIAKLKGARAVGIAGGPEKVAHLRELGFDAAIDHRAPDFADQLAAATPDGIDVYFENVGGKVWDEVLGRLNLYARVPVCGVVAHYNDTELPAGPDRMPALMRHVLNKSLTIRGFIQTEFAPTHMKEFLAEATPWVREGKLQFREDVVEGLENAPEAFAGLLQGRNFGKLLIKV